MYYFLIILYLLLKLIQIQQKIKIQVNSGTIDPSDYDPADAINDSSDSKAVEKAGKIIGAIQGFGSIVSLGVIIYIGIRYMIGSTEEKAMYKETMIPYFVGAILVFSGANIVGAIYNALA